MDRIAIGATTELSRRFFWDYCQTTAGTFYKSGRTFLKDLCNELQSFLSDDEHDVLVINEPPRHGKSRTGGKFVEWVLGNNQSKKIMTGSYNETLSTTFSKGVRNAIQEIKADKNRIIFSDVFPGVSIKQGDGAMNLWSLTNGYNNYLATSPTGTATGFGADIIIIDDLIKNAEEANNAMVLEKHWDWFVNTMLSRLETGGKIIIIMTRWHSEDLAGRALRELPNSGYRVKHVNMQAYNEKTGEMLSEDILSLKEYQRKVKTMGADIAAANYQQTPIDIKGRLYQNLKTYDQRSEYKKIWSYCDTADTGKDYLCSIVWGETSDGRCEVLDVIYTQEPMEYTESAVSNQYINNKVNQARIERNNGGRSFARSVREKVKGKCPVAIDDFYQSANKEARIYSNTAWIEQNVYFPEDWRTKWPEYYSAMTTYQREGKNKHDDAPDATTGIAETMSMNVKEKVNVKKTINAFKKLGL
ncbi:phage terminase large subunit [Enterococcus raffinosus]|uniref:Phage terminase large subunit n=1 Tax=Enterococcus raffinosus TaxID=71452 RepID=A0AAW8TFM6_9ENTE|nr:phage terminase large subunit [Enterococcus raffinosus]MDT2525597.1 phage terminase large subunit [Enterococcus raffinosus]MDT2536135.1 phage terminase large subunit [Enterococcus raffinosus]MDT2546605.1 phage terminase large subunit [Enterococcus raffinosus]MDT2557107.1 phage terminase large subunit [Enterococcus raffinosus]MDT2580230.1 phage terminase large subunit [Enterococcus raffinosus]